MSVHEKIPGQNGAPVPAPEGKSSLPVGYRAGIVTAITVILGFSFLFLRSWAFELPGEWTFWSAAAAILLLLSILGQLYALWRSLQLHDDEVANYQATLRWFFGAILLLMVSLVTAALSYSQIFKD